MVKLEIREARSLIRNPIYNSLVVSKLFKYLNNSNLLLCREVSILWNEEASLILRKRNFSPSIQLPNDLDLISSIYSTQEIPNLISSVNIDIQSVTINIESFFQTFGQNLRKISLDFRGESSEDKILTILSLIESNVSPLVDTLSIQSLNMPGIDQLNFPHVKHLTVSAACCPKVHSVMNTFPKIESISISTGDVKEDDWHYLNPTLNTNGDHRWVKVSSLKLPIGFKNCSILVRVLKAFPTLKKLEVRAKDSLVKEVFALLKHLEELTLIIPDSQPASLFVNHRRLVPSNFTDEGITGIPFETCELIRKGEITHLTGIEARQFPYIGNLKHLKKLKIKKKPWDIFPLTEVSLFCGINDCLFPDFQLEVPCQYMTELSKYLIDKKPEKSTILTKR